MNKQEFSLKRVALGVLVGVIGISGFAGIGRVTQTNMFSEMFAWLVADTSYPQEWYDAGCVEGQFYDFTTGTCITDDGAYDECGEGYYFDDSSQTCQQEGSYDDGDCYDSSGNYTCGDQDENYDDSTQGCGQCDGQCVQVGETFSCEPWDTQDDQYQNDQNDYQDQSQDNQNYDNYDPEMEAEDLENMADRLEESLNWEEDVTDAKGEAEEWMDDLADRIENWQEDSDDMSEDPEMDTSVYVAAIAYAQDASAKIEELLPKFDELISEAATTRTEMETAYEDYVSAGNGDSSAFWDIQNNSGINDWRDIYRSEAEMHGRPTIFYDFLIESSRIENETGMTAEEIGGDFATAVATAESILTELPALLAEVPAMLDAAEAEIAAGEEAYRVLDDVRDYFDDMRDLMDAEKDMWDSMEDAWDLVKDKEMQNFQQNEIAQIREGISWVTGELDSLEVEGKDVSEARELIEEATSLLDKIEATTDTDELEDLMKDLDKIGKKAEKELSKLGIEFGPDNKQAYIDSIDMNDLDADALMTLLSQVSQNVLEQVIQMLLANVNSADIESFISYSEEYGDIGFFDSSSIAYMDSDTLDAMIADKLAILEGLDAEIASRTDELMALSEKIAGYNFYGDSVDKVVELQSDLYTEIEDASDEEVKDIVAEYDEQVEDLKNEAREEKFDDGLIPFIDTDDNQWFTSYVMDVKDQGIISGYKDSEGNLTGEFGPSDNVTVGEILKMSLESAGQGEGQGTPNNPYAQNSWSAGYFDKAEDLGMSIVEDMTQDPNDSATRGEVIQSLFESLGGVVTVPTDTDTTFQDVPKDYEYYDAIAYAQELGIISGDNGEGETFRPEDSVNRAETAKMIDAFMETMELEGLVEY